MGICTGLASQWIWTRGRWLFDLPSVIPCCLFPAVIPRCKCVIVPACLIVCVLFISFSYHTTCTLSYFCARVTFYQEPKHLYPEYPSPKKLLNNVALWIQDWYAENDPQGPTIKADGLQLDPNVRKRAPPFQNDGHSCAYQCILGLIKENPSLPMNFGNISPAPISWAYQKWHINQPHTSLHHPVSAAPRSGSSLKISPAFPPPGKAAPHNDVRSSLLYSLHHLSWQPRAAGAPHKAALYFHASILAAPRS